MKISQISELTKQAINASLKSLWNEAILLNKKILKKEPKNTDASNRLAFAYQASGSLNKAIEIYKIVLKQDPCNLIAFKSLKKLKDFNLKRGFIRTNISFNNKNLFVEEQGKTKIVNLLNLNSKSVLSSLNCGDKLIICTKKRSIILKNEKGDYLGVLPDDLAFRLLPFIRKGNQYEAYVRSVTKNTLWIFMRETFKVSKLKIISSFPIKIDKINNSQEKQTKKEEESADYSCDEES